MRMILVVLGLAGGSYLCTSVRWEVFLGVLYFSGFGLVALVGFLYRDPRREESANFADD
jgi:hypothetical protein